MAKITREMDGGGIVQATLCGLFGVLINFFVSVYPSMSRYPMYGHVEVVMVSSDAPHHSAKMIHKVRAGTRGKALTGVNGGLDVDGDREGE
jgi:hypothetical protein